MMFKMCSNAFVASVLSFPYRLQRYSSIIQGWTRRDEHSSNQNKVTDENKSYYGIESSQN